ncbi:MAG TPA: hypothetical protein VFJ74_07865 [Gemmatimonadaceae bacterium]|nr:hypothetical protein [Gemmatimonadaceae bacterium]
MIEMMETLQELLASSHATPEFKADVLAYASYQDAPRITTARHAPRIKVLRLVAQLLSAEPSLPVERVRVEGLSGCADFRGTATVEAGGETRTFEFVWDCHWRAVQEGWTDAFGLPDQIRAAREFGWRCFERWAERDAGARVPGSLVARA